MGWWLGLAPATLKFWVRFPNERNQGKQGAILCKSTGFLMGPTSPAPHANSFVLGPAVINTHTPYFLTVTVEAGSNRSIISLFFF